MKYNLNVLLILAIFALPGCQIINRINSPQIQDKAQIMPESDIPEVLDDGSELIDPPVKDPLIVDEPELIPLEEEPVKLEPNPKIIDLSVGFASQAPFAVWDELHQEACEEASMIMVANYFNNKPISSHIMEQGLLSVIKWETDQGYKVDATAQEVVNILSQYYGVTAQTSNDVSVNFIKSQLVQGNLIIIPAAGRELGNPNFSGDGPIYHMLIVRGYDDNTKEFITNDPGTKRGEGYRYSYDVLINAIHNWDHDLAKDGMTDAEMALGSKILIVVSP